MSLLILNVALFLPVVLAGLAASWVGWRLAGPDEARGSGGGGGSGARDQPPPALPLSPSPLASPRTAGPEDLARSA